MAIALEGKVYGIATLKGTTPPQNSAIICDPIELVSFDWCWETKIRWWVILLPWRSIVSAAGYPGSGTQGSSGVIYGVFAE